MGMIINIDKAQDKKTQAEEKAKKLDEAVAQRDNDYKNLRRIEAEYYEAKKELEELTTKK